MIHHRGEAVCLPPSSLFIDRIHQNQAVERGVTGVKATNQGPAKLCRPESDGAAHSATKRQLSASSLAHWAIL